MFVAEGVKIAEELLHSNFEIVRIYALAEWIENHPAKKNAHEISEDELKKISNLKTPNQVIAIVKKKIHKKPVDLQNAVSLVLDNIQDPGNFGTIIRTADWFGITNIIAGTDTVDVYNSKVIQSTTGSFIRTNIFYTDLKKILQQAAMPVYGALLEGKNVFEVGKINEGLLVIGNESKGISKNLLPFVQHAITIPRKGKAESLNAAVATGIILSHLVT
ncbi:MAG: RNA methyltransferase [Parafilimonas sp.]